MTEEARRERNRLRLMECYPTFRTRLQAVLTELEGKGIRPRIQEAWRTPATQRAAYLTGHSKLKFGFHCCESEGKPAALAADVLDDDSPLNPGIPYLMALARAAEANGLKTGIRWGLPMKMQTTINRALMAGNDVVTKVGWDPTHVETTGVTLAQVKAGERPA